MEHWNFDAVVLIVPLEVDWEVDWVERVARRGRCGCGWLPVDASPGSAWHIRAKNTAAGNCSRKVVGNVEGNDTVAGQMLIVAGAENCDAGDVVEDEKWVDAGDATDAADAKAESVARLVASG